MVDFHRGSPAKRIINGMEQIMKSLGLKVFEAVEPFRPYIDQDEFTDQPMTLFKDGNWNTHKPFIIGTNREELVKWEAWLKQTSPMSLEVGDPIWPISNWLALVVLFKLQISAFSGGSTMVA